MKRGFLLPKAPKPKPKPENPDVKEYPLAPLTTPRFTLVRTDIDVSKQTPLSYMRAITLPQTQTEPTTLTLLFPGGKEALFAHPGFPAPVIPTPSPPQFSFESVKGKGIGVIAKKNFEPGDLIISERPLTIMPVGFLVSDPAAFTDSFLSNLGKNVEFPLFNSLHNCKGPEMSRSMGILNTNAVHIELPGCSGDYSAVCAMISRLNHSCSPNAEMVWRFESFCEQAIALRPIRAGEEILVTYTCPDNPRAMRQEDLFKKYSFKCTCEACVLPEKESRRNDICRSLLNALNKEAMGNPTTIADPACADLTDDRDVRTWVGDASLSDDHIIKRSMRVVDMMDQGAVCHESLSAMHYRALCLAYVALGDRENSSKWARKAAAMSRVYQGHDGGWGKWVDAPQDSPLWGKRVKASASQGSSGKGL